MYVCRYGTAELEDEGGYIALEFSCLWPAAENEGLLGAPERYPGARNDYRCHTFIHTCIHTLKFPTKNMYICIYIHTYIHTYNHYYRHICIHLCMHTYIHTCIHTYIQL